MWGEKGKQKKEAIIGKDNYTFLGSEVDIRGKAQFEGTVRVDGRFEGGGCYLSNIILNFV